VHYTKISAELECGVIASLGAHPKNVALGYDVGKISAGCLVGNMGLMVCRVQGALSLRWLYTIQLRWWETS